MIQDFYIHLHVEYGSHISTLCTYVAIPDKLMPFKEFYHPLHPPTAGQTRDEHTGIVHPPLRCWEGQREEEEESQEK